MAESPAAPAPPADGSPAAPAPPADGGGPTVSPPSGPRRPFPRPTVTLSDVDATILWVMGAVVGITLVARLVAEDRTDPDKKQGAQVFRVIAGGLFGAAGLMGIARLNAPLARGLAYLTLGGSIYTYGEPLMTLVSDRFKGEWTVVTPTQITKGP